MTTTPRRLIPLIDLSGRNKAVEPTDPFVATAMTVSTPGYDGLAAMGRALVEEFALMGWSRERVRRMFENPRYRAASLVYQARGPSFVDGVIGEVFGADGREGI